MQKSIGILWNVFPVEGTITLTNAGTVSGLKAVGAGNAWGDRFSLGGVGSRLLVDVDAAMLDIGPFATVVNVRAKTNPFSFFLRDVRAEHPIYIPQYGVAVTLADDGRSFGQIAAAIEARGLQTRMQEIASRPERSFEEAAKITRNMKCVTWLGLSRDIRNFEISLHSMKAVADMWDSVQPKYHGFDVALPEVGGKPVRYDFFCGRGHACTLERKRWLEKGVLPVLNVCTRDEDVSYTYTMFATLERRALTAGNVLGTHYLVVDRYSQVSMQTAEQERLAGEMHDGEIYRDEETVCYVRVQALNESATPKYSYVRIPQPNVQLEPAYLMTLSAQYDGLRGFGSYHPDSVFVVASVNGRPVPNIEMAVLLAPGERAEYVFKIPHRPVSEARAHALSAVAFEAKLEECKAYWDEKLGDMAALSLPEKRIDEMMRAGTLHCDLVAYGREPDGAIAPTIGIFSPIGSESAPILQYLDSMGLHDLARRGIMYFLEKQHRDGFMQNFGGYMLETGCVLWTIGEHWRYTRDDEWIRSIRGNIHRALDFIVAWRNRNKREELRGRGYGMLEGKVADPEDNYHIFMLNSTAYVGIKRAAEVLGAIRDGRAAEVAAESEAFLSDIRDSFDLGLAEAPAVPLGNGAWCPSLPVWADRAGPLCLQTQGGAWFTHGSAVARDSLVSAQYLLLDEVIPPDGLQAGFLLDCLADAFFTHNTAFSQPYYSPHPWANLRRGEVKAFLEEFYMNMSSLADRETYTFWEHYFQASPHKVHEEAWFLMRCRWMLYLEADDALNVLPGIPRAWMEDGKEVHLHGAASYFGEVHIDARSDASSGRISVRAQVNGAASRLPKTLVVRVPHPKGMKAFWVSAGVYDPICETVTIDSFAGEATIQARF